MKKQWWMIGVAVVLVIAGFFTYRYLVGAQASSTANLQTATVERGTITAGISAAGTVRSGQSAVISWQTSGKVAEVLVKLGDHVQADQELASLDPSSLSPTLLNAQQSLNEAKKNLDDLLNSKLQQAQALQAVQDAQNALDTLKQTAATNAANAQVALANAQQALKDAQTKRDKMNYPHSTDPYVIENAHTKYLVAKQAYQDALKNFNKVANRKLTDPERVAALQNLVAAEAKMKTAYATYNWYLLPYTPEEIAQADAELAQAKANLAQAQAQYDQLKNGPDAAAVALAEAKLADAQREWERLKGGADPADIAAAQAAVDAAQATLNQMHLVAPFEGTITAAYVNVGDLVSSGKNAFQIDDLSSIYVDVTVAEVDINSVKIGQQATLTFDAIPGKEYTGEVTEIGLVGTASQGVVNYPVTVRITNADENVKPGMTAAVTITVAAHENVLIVPNQAIRVSGGQRTVTILFEGQQISIPVTVGLSNGTQSEVNSSQLREGDTVVLNTSSASTTQRNSGGPFIGGGFFR